MSSRITNRKRIILTFLHESKGLPFLLEELRWKVLRQEYESTQRVFDVMTYSAMKSFTRTIREYMPDLLLHKLTRPDEISCGIVTRAAVYRLRRWIDIEEFLAARDACVYCKYQSKLNLKSLVNQKELRCELYTARYSYDKYGLSWAPYEERRDRWMSISLFPISQPLTLVAENPVTTEDLVELSKVDWEIFRVSDGGLRRLKSSESIRTKWRRYRVKPLRGDVKR